MASSAAVPTEAEAVAEPRGIERRRAEAAEADGVQPSGVKRSRTEETNELDGEATARGELLGLSEELRQRVLSFCVASPPVLVALAAADRACRNWTRAPAAWEGALIVVPRSALSRQPHLNELLRLAAVAWGLCSEVALPAHPMRRAVDEQLRRVWPDLKLSVRGDGPYCLFVMPSYAMKIGCRVSLHLFEPRYRWMVRRTVAGPRPHVVGFVTNPTIHAGALCEIVGHERCPDGTFDVDLQCIGHFVVLEAWDEQVPNADRMPPLKVGYLHCSDKEPSGQMQDEEGSSWEEEEEEEEYDDEDEQEEEQEDQ